MRRYDFTYNLCALLQYMCNEGDFPILDYVKRSTEEQKRMFALGVSKCDGVTKISGHQLGLDADIYLLNENGKLIDWGTIPEKATKYHTFWEASGGASMISWDLGHFGWLIK